MSDAREAAMAVFRGAFPDLTDASDVDLAVLRQCDDELWDRFARPEAVVEAVDAGGVPALWVRMPGVRSDRAIVWLHGGGYTIGSAAGRRGIAAALGEVAGCAVLVPDYRLAPEHPHPAALNDALAAIAWAADEIGDAGAGGLVVGGDSAGGGLALAALLAARDRGGPQVAGAIAMSPLADWTLHAGSHDANRDRDPFVTVEMLEWLRPGFLGAADPRDPLVSPRFGDYAGLPPLLVLTGTAETLLDDARGVTAAARTAGVAAEHHEFDDMFHLWPMFASMLPEGAEAVGLMGEFARRRLGLG